MPGSSSSVSAAEREPIATAVEVLVRGGVVVYPTETLYGLGADAFNPSALRRLVQLKGRQPDKPIAVLISEIDMLQDLVSEVPPDAEALMRRFWPGPLTIVLRAAASVSPVLTGGSGGIGVRISSHPMATALVRALGRPITAPSANPAGMRPPTRLDEARAYFGTRVDYYLDGGTLPGEPASTVVEVGDGCKVIREGAIAAATLRASLRDTVKAW